MPLKLKRQCTALPWRKTTNLFIRLHCGYFKIIPKKIINKQNGTAPIENQAESSLCSSWTLVSSPRHRRKALMFSLIRPVATDGANVLVNSPCDRRMALMFSEGNRPSAPNSILLEPITNQNDINRNGTSFCLPIIFNFVLFRRFFLQNFVFLFSLALY